MSSKCDFRHHENVGFGWRRLLIFLLVIATIFVFACEGFGGFDHRRGGFDECC